jgi:hypothetical protein
LETHLIYTKEMKQKRDFRKQKIQFICKVPF